MTWNTQSVRMAETCGGAAPLPGSWLDMSYKRYDPDFLPDLLQRVAQSKCDWFVCALQESAKPGSHFLSDALPHALAALDFVALHRNRMMGVGATTVQTMVRDGSILTRGLRLALYVKREWLQSHRCSLDENWWHATPRDVLTRGKGALAICVHVAGLGRVCVMNCHLPFDAPSVARDNAARVTSGMSQQVCALRSLVQRCCTAHMPHYLVVMGDLNFRVLNLSDGLVQPNAIFDALVHSPESRRTIFERRDELRLALGYGALPALREGCDNEGAWRFMPTGKMRHGRESGSTDRRAYFFGKRCEQNPSWCDRVLYARTEDWADDGTLQTDVESATQCKNSRKMANQQPVAYTGEGRGVMRCATYDRFEAGQTMTRSDHSAVIATIDILYIEKKDSDAKAAERESPELLLADAHLCSAVRPHNNAQEGHIADTKRTQKSDTGFPEPSLLSVCDKDAVHTTRTDQSRRCANVCFASPTEGRECTAAARKTGNDNREPEKSKGDESETFSE